MPLPDWFWEDDPDPWPKTASIAALLEYMRMVAPTPINRYPPPSQTIIRSPMTFTTPEPAKGHSYTFSLLKSRTKSGVPVKVIMPFSGKLVDVNMNRDTFSQIAQQTLRKHSRIQSFAPHPLQPLECVQGEPIQFKASVDALNQVFAAWMAERKAKASAST